MQSTFTVASAAANTNISTLDAVKIELKITTTDEDDYITGLLPRLTRRICDYIGVPEAQDLTSTIARETLTQTIRMDCAAESLILARRNVTSITSVTEDGVVLDAADYEIDGPAGLLYRLCGDYRTMWCARKVEITLVAGWLMPDDDGRNLPEPIEEALFLLVKGARFSRTADDQLRSENVLGGLYSYTRFDPDKQDELPTEVCSRLDPYCYA